jgi:nitrile hydratase accessory protein
MTPELDVDGPAAPPRSNGELSFEHPWQGRLFATTMAACDAGLIEYPVFRDRLIAGIAERDRREPQAGDYWSAWQDALEALVVDLGLVGPGEIDREAAEFSQHH